MAGCDQDGKSCLADQLSVRYMHHRAWPCAEASAEELHRAAGCRISAFHLQGVGCRVP